jgi:hypothetical protein
LRGKDKEKSKGKKQGGNREGRVKWEGESMKKERK